ncbi:MAG TPA: hypothetical protein VES20_20885 [Bryobacteraceae bacterium]|nr:hypothetical protein [Bryobacteraceae bacterium]
MQKRFAGALLICACLFGEGKLPPNVPEGATETSPGVYRFVDKEKKAWIYRPTPFGYARSPEEAESRDNDAAPARPAGAHATPFGESRPSPNMPQTKATEAGDSVRFERLTPFGPSRWTKKKTELNDDERRIWEAQRSSAPGPATTKK